MDNALVFFYGVAISSVFAFGLFKYIVATKKEKTLQIQNHYENWGN